VSAAACLRAPQKWRGLPGSRWQVPGAHPSSRAPAAAPRLPPYRLSAGSWRRLAAPARHRLACRGMPAAPVWPVSGPGAASPPTAWPPSPAGPGSARSSRTESWDTATTHVVVPAAGVSLGWPGGASGEEVAEDWTWGPGETLPPRDFGVGKLPQ